MRQARAKVIGLALGEHLRLAFQATEGMGMENPVAVALEVVAVRMGGFRIPAATPLCDLYLYFLGPQPATGSGAALHRLANVLQ